MSVKRFSLALVLCAAMAFTACDKEGGNQPGPDTDPVTPTENTVDVAYAIGGGADFLLIFDAEVKYTDATGKTATEKISSLPWSKELTGLALPYTAKMEITLTARESYEEKEQYELGFGHAISYETSDGRTYGGLNVSKQTVGKDKIAKYQGSCSPKVSRRQSKYRPNRELPDTAGEGRSDGAALSFFAKPVVPNRRRFHHPAKKGGHAALSPHGLLPIYTIIIIEGRIICVSRPHREVPLPPCIQGELRLRSIRSSPCRQDRTC